LETDNRSRQELLADAVQARHEVERFRQAALLMNDKFIEEMLMTRSVELENLAKMLEARAAKRLL